MVGGNRGPTTESGHVSRLMLARLLAGDLDEPARASLETHLSSCAACGAVFARAKQDAAFFAAKHPTLESLAAGRRSAPAREPEPSPSLWRRIADAFDRGFGPRPALAAFGLLAVVAVLWTVRGRHPAEDLSAKGGAHFTLTLNGEPVRGETIGAAPSDTLQLALNASAPVHYAVLYRDDGGTLDPYMGGEGESQRPVGSAQGENLPHSLVLGGGWASEILYCVWSERPFNLDEAREAVEGHGKTPAGLHVQVFRLKNTRP